MGKNLGSGSVSGRKCQLMRISTVNNNKVPLSPTTFPIIGNNDTFMNDGLSPEPDILQESGRSPRHAPDNIFSFLDT